MRVLLYYSVWILVEITYLPTHLPPYLHIQSFGHLRRSYHLSGFHCSIVQYSIQYYIRSIYDSGVNDSTSRRMSSSVHVDEKIFSSLSSMEIGREDHIISSSSLLASTTMTPLSSRPTLTIPPPAHLKQEQEEQQIDFEPSSSSTSLPSTPDDNLPLKRLDTAPSQYFALPLWRKSLIVFITSWTTLSVTFASTSLFTAVGEIASDFNVSSQTISLSNAAVLLVMGCSSFIWAPIARIVGRRWAWIGALVVIILCSIGVACARNVEAFVALRLIAALQGTCFHVFGQGILADIFEPVQRGTATGFFLFGTVLGPPLGKFFCVWISWFELILLNRSLYSWSYTYFLILESDHMAASCHDGIRSLAFITLSSGHQESIEWCSETKGESDGTGIETIQHHENLQTYGLSKCSVHSKSIAGTWIRFWSMIEKCWQENPGLDLWTAQLVTIYTSCRTASFVKSQISSHNTLSIWPVLSCSWNWFSCWNCHWWKILGLDCAKMDPYERWSSSSTR